MFDFGADGRGEGGENGMNHKGLVTFDRSYKKDAFYAYKAWLNPEPMVHLCGKRYVDRAEDVTKVTVYSNLPSVRLYANGKLVGEREAADHFFHFEVPISGDVELVAVAGDRSDSSHVRRVAEPNPAYRLVERGAILNWWDITEVEGMCSLNSSVRDVVIAAGNELAAELLQVVMGLMVTPESVQGLMGPIGSMSVIRFFNLAAGMMGVKIGKEELLELNARLNELELPAK